MKHFFYQLSLCFFVITSCSAMEKIWYTSGNEAKAEDYRSFLEKRNIKMSEEDFALFSASLAHLESVKEQKPSIFENNDSQEEDDTKILIEKTDTTQSK